MSQPRTMFAGMLVVLLVAASIALARSGGDGRVMGDSERGSPPPAPRDAQAGASPAAPGNGFLGVILARSSADVAPRFEGKLKAVHVRLGDVVAAGALIATLDVPSLRFDLSMAEASLKAAEVDQERAAIELAQAEEQLNRRKTLSDASLASAEDLATSGYQRKLAASRLESARAQVAERRGRVGLLRKDNADAEIRAPFEGIVAARYVDPGANVAPSTPIVRLISARDLFVRFAVPEGSASNLSAGAEVTISAGGTTLRGKVDKVAPEIDAASRMIVVEAKIDAELSSTPLRSGEMVRVSIEGKP
jgi:RND family efflux transporter MFP subunit